jgi:hypothetical protein
MSGQIPTFKSAFEVIAYTKENAEHLTPKEVFSLFDSLFSLQHQCDLRKNADIMIFFKDDKLKSFIKSLSPSEQIKVVKRFSQMELKDEKEWNRLFKLVTDRAKDMTASELYELMKYSLELTGKKTDKETWKQLMKDIGRRIDEYDVKTLIGIVKAAAKLKIDRKNFWKSVNKKVLHHLQEYDKEQLKELIEKYMSLDPPQEEIVKKMNNELMKKSH